MPPKSKPERAPSVSASALVDLLNSRSYAGLPDKLDDPASAAGVLRPFGHTGRDVSPERVDAVRAIRAELVSLVGTDGASPGWRRLTRLASEVTFAREFASSGEPRLRPVTGDPVLAAIVEAVATLVAAGDWTRIKLCANDVCLGAFFDTTRSRTRRWHSYEMCGNRLNVAAHRARMATDRS